MSGNAKFACIRFLDRKTENLCVPINFIKIKNSKKQLVSFNPKDENDFHKHNIYFVKWQCPNKCNDDHEHNGYYRAQIGFLAEKEVDVQKQMRSERVRYCSQEADITSSDYEDSSLEVQVLSRGKKHKTDTVKRNVAITIAQDVLQSYKKNHFLNERPKISDNFVTNFANQRNSPNDIPNDVPNDVSNDVPNDVPNDVLHKDTNVEDNVEDKVEDNVEDNVEDRNQEDVVDDVSDDVPNDVSTISDNERMSQRSRKTHHVKRRLFNRNILQSSSDSDNASTSHENVRCSFEEENNNRYSEQNIDDNEDNDVSCEGQNDANKSLHKNTDENNQPKSPSILFPSYVRKRLKLSRLAFYPVNLDNAENKPPEKKIGWDCWECREYYKNLSLSKEEVQKRKNQCSRHKYERPNTPEGFWDPEFPETLS